ncbi:hypothetical protein [Phocaeicola sartorii]|uniref:hypothetical protein n=1 Tax=Phocaeicola sartorii TaxID=671267 RepID=UPI001F56ABD5|nr:hypothetical protein [Phocaeicola sartorii]
MTSNSENQDLNKIIVDKIAKLIKEANSFSNVCDINDISDVPMYDNIGDAKIHIDNTLKEAGDARKTLDELKNLPDSKFYTIGRNKAKTEQTQVIIGHIVDALDNNAEATKTLFNNQVKLARFSKQLFGLGLMSIAANRIIVREIKLRLENASEEELSDLAVQELQNVIFQLKLQQSLVEKQEEQNQKIKVIETKLEDFSEANDLILNNITSISQNIVLLKNKLKESFNDIEQHNSLINTLFQEVQKLNKLCANLSEDLSKKELIIKKLDDDVTSLLYAVKEQNDSILGLKSKIKILEKKTFLDTVFYKIIVGFFSFFSFLYIILSLVFR